MERWITSFFGLGWIRPGPGTWGSVGGLLLWWALIFVADLPLAILIGLFVLLNFVAVWAIRRVEKKLQIEDAGEIVIDEVLGIFIPILLSDGSFLQLLIAFVLFRFFDILKPFGARYFDRNHLLGWGVILDDIVAGVYAGALIFALNFSEILELW